MLDSTAVFVERAGADAATSAAQSELDPSDFAAAPALAQQRASRQVVGWHPGDLWFCQRRQLPAAANPELQHYNRAQPHLVVGFVCVLEQLRHPPLSYRAVMT